MRHRKAGLKLNRTSSHRKAMFRNMVTSLFKYKRIQTTDTKAKELRRWADHLITLAKRGDLHARRQALSIIREKDVVHALFEEVEEKFGGTSGGYTRVIKIGRRPGDAAPVSLIELVMAEKSKKKKKKKGKAPAAKKASAKAEVAAPKGADTAADAAVASEKAEVAPPKTAPVEDKKAPAPEAAEEKPEMDAAAEPVAEEKAVDAEAKEPAAEETAAKEADESTTEKAAEPAKEDSDKAKPKE